jgi:hypothetical protein
MFLSLLLHRSSGTDQYPTAVDRTFYRYRVIHVLLNMLFLIMI